MEKIKLYYYHITYLATIVVKQVAKVYLSKVVSVVYGKNTMADLTTRREARRRKILENSKNRLKLITGENEELVYGIFENI